MAKKDDGKNPFTMTFSEHDVGFYLQTPEGSRVKRALTGATAALTGTDAAERSRMSPKSAILQLFEAMTAKEEMLSLSARLIAGWLQSNPGQGLTPKEVRRARSAFLTLLARGNVDDVVRNKHMIRERQVGQMAHAIAGIVHFLPADSVQVFAEWAADMAVGDPDYYEAQPMAVIRGVLFSPWVVAAFDVGRAREFWKSAVAEPAFPWNIFSHPCRADRGSMLTEFHVSTISKVLTVAPEEAVDRIAKQMIDFAKEKRIEEAGKDALEGLCRTERFVPAEPHERRQLFQGVLGGVTNALHEGRRARVAELFKEVID